jgi:hypothetical protein
MLLRTHLNRYDRPAPAASRRHSRSLLWVRGFLCLIGLGVLSTVSNFSSQGVSQSGLQNPDKPLLMPDANRPPDANQQMAMHEQQAKNKNLDAANIERKRQITDDSARLLKLASDLKAEVDKTSKDTLSLGVIRKAEEIEKLAHNVKEKMKLTMGAN